MENVVGYLGPPGTFSSKAATRISANTKPFQSIRDVAEALENKEIKWGVLPIENSLEGAVTETMDLLLEIENSHIIKEIILPIKYVLLAGANQEFHNIHTVISHPQALAQCKELFSQYPHLNKETTTSTAKAAEKVRDKKSIAALSPASCKDYNLKVLWEGPKKQYNNETRFIVLGNNSSSPTGNDRTSIVFGVQDSPGALYKALEVFSILEINLTRIESRPSKRKLGEYVFYVDLEGHKDDTNAYKALKGVEKHANFLKILGSYPKESEQSA